MDENNDDPIIAFKKQKRYTNIDYREKLALNADQLLELRKTCSLINDSNEFSNFIIILIYILHHLVQKEN